jgi:hypothetical protein
MCAAAIFSCEKHVKESLKLLDAPHVIILSHYTKKKCKFCQKKAVFKFEE